MLAIFYHHERHTRGDDARHRPNSAQAMAGLHMYPTRLDKGLGTLEVRCPAFILHRPHYSPLHWTTHGFPRYWWAGVQDGIGAELGQELTSGMHGHQVGPGRIDTLQRLRIGVVYW
jgi:hypothetical protein